MNTIAIIGASGGIGSALARRLTASAHHVLLVGRSADRLAPLGAELGCAMAVADAGDADSLQQALAGAGPLQGIVNCAGSVLIKPAHLTSDQEWSAILQANLTTAFNVVRAGARLMTQTGGSIVLCSSAAARMGLANHEAIAAAKAGVIGLTLSAAATYARRNIRINCVAPGLVETGLMSKITRNELALKASLGMHALGRAGRPEQIASMIAWLLDAENDWATGQVFGVDGGLGTLRS